jgi:hypothetical protein
MHSKLALSILAVAVFAACGGAAPGATTKPNPGQSSGTTATNPPGAQVDCAAIKTAAQQLVGLQLMAQMTDVETAESIKDKNIGNLDPDAMLAALATLHALDSYVNPLGDPKAAIELFERSAQAAKVLFAKDPMTQADVDAYYETVGSVGTFIGNQAAISGAVGEAGC